MESLDHRIRLFSRRVRVGLLVAVAAISVIAITALAFDRGSVWLRIDGLDLGMISEGGVEGAPAVDPSTGEELDATAQFAISLEDLEEEPIIWLGVVPILIAAVFYALFILQTERLFAAYQRGELFSSANARRIRNIGLLFCAAGLVAMLDSLGQSFFLETEEFVLTQQEDGAAAAWSLVRSIHLPIPFFLGGVVIVLIARVMEKGASIQKEMDRLV